MEINCKNCNTNFIGNFCYNCGQPANTKRLDFHSIWHDLQHGLLHFDKGIFYTIKQLFTKPGHTIREYLEGKRVKHFKPFSLVVLLATIYALLYHYLNIGMIEETRDAISMRTFGIQYNLNITYGTDRTPLAQTIRGFIDSNFALIQIVSLPFFAGASRLAFRKEGYTYFEHLVINAFIRGQALILASILLPFLYFGWINRELHSGILQLLQLVFVFWTFLQLFNSRKKWWIVKKSLLGIVFLVLEILALVLLFVLFLLIAGLITD